MNKYVSIFDRKTNLINTKDFAMRVNVLIENSYYGSVLYRYLNERFISEGVGYGYSSIHDFLKGIFQEEAKDIFRQPNRVTENESEPLVLANIEIYSNALRAFMLYRDHPIGRVSEIYKSFSNFLTQKGYKLITSGNRMEIVSAELPAGVDEIMEVTVRADFLSFFNYINVGDIHEKRKILMSLVQKLEIRKSEMKDLLGNDAQKMYGFYANKFHIRHNDVDQVKGLNCLELEEWYNYIYALFIRIYIGLDKLKKVSL
jgi:hypothetical protein